MLCWNVKIVVTFNQPWKSRDVSALDVKCSSQKRLKHIFMKNLQKLLKTFFAKLFGLIENY